jgi:hypothetical protein
MAKVGKRRVESRRATARSYEVGAPQHPDGRLGRRCRQPRSHRARRRKLHSAMECAGRFVRASLRQPERAAAGTELQFEATVDGCPSYVAPWFVAPRFEKRLPRHCASGRMLS